MDHAGCAVLYGGRLVNRFLSQDRRRMDFIDLALHPDQHRRVGLGHVEKRHRLGAADLHGRDTEHPGPFDASKNRRLACEPGLARSPSVYQPSRAHVHHYRPHYVCSEIILHELPYRRDTHGCPVAPRCGHEHQPVDCGHDRTDCLGGLVFSFSSGLAHSGFFNHRG